MRRASLTAILFFVLMADQAWSQEQQSKQEIAAALDQAKIMGLWGATKDECGASGSLAAFFINHPQFGVYGGNFEYPTFVDHPFLRVLEATLLTPTSIRIRMQPIDIRAPDTYSDNVSEIGADHMRTLEAKTVRSGKVERISIRNGRYTTAGRENTTAITKCPGEVPAFVLGEIARQEKLM